MDSGVRDEVELLEEELQTLTVKGEALDPMGKPTIVCSVLTEKLYNKESLKAHFRGLWKAPGGFEFQDAGPNLFLIRFEKDDDMRNVLNGSPWLFRRQTVLMKALTRPATRQEIRFVTSPVWLRLVKITPGYDREDLVRRVGLSFRGVLDSEVSKTVCRLKVEIDVRQPLRRGVKIRMEGDELEPIYFTYENLPFHCVACGRIGHVVKDCKRTSDEQKRRPEEEQPFGKGLRSEWGGQGLDVFRKADEGGRRVKQRCYLAEEKNAGDGGDGRTIATVTENRGSNLGIPVKVGSNNNPAANCEIGEIVVHNQLHECVKKGSMFAAINCNEENLSQALSITVKEGQDFGPNQFDGEARKEQEGSHAHRQTWKRRARTVATKSNDSIMSCMGEKRPREQEHAEANQVQNKKLREDISSLTAGVIGFDPCRQS